MAAGALLHRHASLQLVAEGFGFAQNISDHVGSADGRPMPNCSDSCLGHASHVNGVETH